MRIQYTTLHTMMDCEHDVRFTMCEVTELNLPPIYGSTHPCVVAISCDRVHHTNIKTTPKSPAPTKNFYLSGNYLLCPL